MIDKINDELIIQKAFEHFRKAGFPYIELADYEIYQLFKRLQESESKLIANKKGLIIDFVKTLGVNECRGDQFLANHFHRHIWDSKAYGMRAPTQSYEIDNSLKKVMQLCIKYYNEITLKNVRHHLRTVNGTQMCSNFRPSAAKAVYDYFGANDVLDMSAGYGGRLIGFLASKAKGKYTGIDPSEKTCEGNLKIASFFKQEKRIRIIQKPFEEATRLPKVGLAFTSPPYFKKEIYDEGSPLQSSQRYPEYDLWICSFLSIMMEKTYKALKPKGIMALNIQDVKIASKIYPLTHDTIVMAENIGFKFIERLDIIFPGFGRGLSKKKTEPILVFRKG